MPSPRHYVAPCATYLSLATPRPRHRTSPSLLLRTASRFCLHLHSLLNAPEHAHQRIFLYSSDEPDKKVNAALLMALYAVRRCPLPRALTLCGSVAQARPVRARRLMQADMSSFLQMVVMRWSVADVLHPLSCLELVRPGLPSAFPQASSASLADPRRSCSRAATLPRRWLLARRLSPPPSAHPLRRPPRPAAPAPRPVDVRPRGVRGRREGRDGRLELDHAGLCRVREPGRGRLERWRADAQEGRRPRRQDQQGVPQRPRRVRVQGRQGRRPVRRALLRPPRARTALEPLELAR